MTTWNCETKSQRVIGLEGATLKWGEAFGMGFTFQQTYQDGPGKKNVELSVRRVHRKEANKDELQFTIEIVQRYASGANSRRMYGSLSMNSEALDDFLRRATQVEDKNGEIIAKPLGYGPSVPETWVRAHEALRELTNRFFAEPYSKRSAWMESEFSGHLHDVAKQFETDAGLVRLMFGKLINCIP